jgi:hypothetical protein
MDGMLVIIGGLLMGIAIAVFFGFGFWGILLGALIGLIVGYLGRALQ